MLGINARMPTNRTVLQAQLPNPPNFSGVVFVLYSPRYYDAAFLLAQNYPESFVAVIPADRSYGESAYDPETTRPSTGKQFLARRIAPSANIHRLDGIFGPSREIPYQIRKLPPVIVFHQMQMTAVERIPEPIQGSPQVHLATTEKLTGQKSRVFSNRAINALVYMPALLLMGSIWPPPILYQEEEAVHEMKIDILGGDTKTVAATPSAYKRLITGWAWYLLLAPFLKDNNPIEMGYGSPGQSVPTGGEADCLEQVLSDVSIRKLSESVSPEGSKARRAWFNEACKMHSYKLESIPWFNSYYSPDRLLLIPRNPIVNIYFKTPIPTIKFGRIKWPGICVLMDSNETDPEAPRFIWEHYANNENYLFMALEEADVIEVGPQTGIGFRPHVAE